MSPSRRHTRSRVQALLQSLSLHAEGHPPPFDASRPIRDTELAFLERIRLAPLLDWSLGDDSRATSEDTRKRIAGAVLLARIESERRFRALEELLDDIADIGPQPVLLKGAWSSIDLYPKPHLRIMGDLDLLVERENLPALEERLHKRGYELAPTMPPAFYDTHHHAPPFVHPRTRVKIELHTGLFPAGSPAGQAPVFSQSSLRRNVIPRFWRGRSAAAFRDEFHWIYTATHGAYALPENPLALLDCALLIARRGAQLDWSILESLVDSPIVARSVALFGKLLQHYELVDVPPAGRALFEAVERRSGMSNVAVLRLLYARHVLSGDLHSRFFPRSVGHRVWSNQLRGTKGLRSLASLPRVVLFPPGPGLGARLANLLRRP